MGGESVKRIMSACLEQTNRFESMLDYEAYIANLNRKKVRYKIVEMNTVGNGNVIAQIKKQYNNYDVGNYLD